MKHLDLFSGIAGFACGLQIAGGFETTGFCESDPFCRAVIAKHYPGVKIFEDIHHLTAGIVREHCGLPAIITGGPPCQPSSVAGHRRGAADDRWLWPEFLRVVFALRPLYVLAENPRGVLSIEVEGARFSIWLARQFQAGGYELLPIKLAAEDVGAPHRRERIWFIGRRMEHTQSERRNGQVRDHQWEAVPETVGAGSVANASCRRQRANGSASGRGGHADECGEGVGHADSPESRLSQRSHEAGLWQLPAPERSRHLWPARPGERQHPEEPPRLLKFGVGLDLDGIPERLVRFRNRCALKAAGNAVVPQVVEIIGRAILEMEENTHDL